MADPIYDFGLRVNEDYVLMKKAAASMPRRRVLLATVEVSSRREGLEAAIAALSDTHHELTFVRAPMVDRGKFDNINAAIGSIAINEFDWFVVFDDDIEVQPRFLDDFLYMSEQAGLVLSQPAHRIGSHFSWEVNRRIWGTLARKTHFVECGPITAFHRSIVNRIVPFPATRYAWGIDMLWSEIVRGAGLSLGVIDATPIRHTRPVATSYSYAAATQEMHELLRAYGYNNVDPKKYMVTEAKITGLPDLD